MLAGYDTTAKLLSNSLVVLDPLHDTHAEIVEDLSLLHRRVEEILRSAARAT